MTALILQGNCFPVSKMLREDATAAYKADVTSDRRRRKNAKAHSVFDWKGKTMETITGYVDHIIYRNADNGYTVLVLVCEEEEITCVGIFSGISEGENIEVTGEYTASDLWKAV